MKFILLLILCIISIYNVSAVGISSDNLKYDKKFIVADNTNIKVTDAPDGSGGYLFYSTGTHIKKQKVTVLKSQVKATKFAYYAYGWHKDDDGNVKPIVIPVIEKAGNYEFDIELSATCIGCFTGTYSQTFTALNSSLTSTFSQSLTNITNLTANITDYATYSNPYAINTSGLVGWWRFDNTSMDNSTVVYDYSGNGNNGTWNGNATANYSNGKYNTGLSFDGVNDYVDAGTDNSLNLTNLSVTAMFYLGGLSDSLYIIASKMDRTVVGKESWQIIANSGLLSVGITNTNNNMYFATGGTIVNRTWYHGAMTYNGTLNIYLNGILVNSTSVSNMRTTTEPVRIGTRKKSGTVSEFFNGSIDEVQIYNRSLTASEVAALYYTHLQELQITATGNGTPSGNWNGTNPISIPVASNNSITGLTYSLPNSVLINGITVNDYRNSTKWNITTTAMFTENTTTVSETAVGGFYYLNGSFLPANSSDSGWINLTITDSTFLGSVNKGPASMISNNLNFSLSYINPYLNISTGSLNNSFLNVFNITILYNNAGISPLTYTQIPKIYFQRN